MADIGKVLETVTRKITEVEAMHKEGKRRRAYSSEKSDLVMVQLETLYWAQNLLDEAMGNEGESK